MDQYAHDNVYGHAVDLVEEYSAAPVDPARRAVHLDIGGSGGALGGALETRTGLQYVAVCSEEGLVARLRADGFEAHQLPTTEPSLADSLRAVIDGRQVASLTMLDTLQQLTDPEPTLAAVRAIAAEHAVTAVLSVPNVTHRDIGFKHAFGRWDYTGTGLLDTSQVRHFGAHSFEAELRSAGLLVVRRHDVLQEKSDQHFPSSHPALASGTTLHHLLRGLREEADAHGQVNQFVWACSPGPRSSGTPYLEQREPARPFLSVVMRTQGTRLDCMREALTCLAGQTDQDFEVLVMGHRLDVESQLGVERVIEDTPLSLRTRIRLVRVHQGNRVAPLNDGFMAARGEYIAILDDDDIPLAHWVETFHGLAGRAPGRLLRAVSVLQDIEQTRTLGRAAVRASGGIQKIYPDDFDFLDHLRSNFTPNTAVAFPRGLHHDLGMRFDPELTTTEDWDYMMRAATVVGVASAPEITCIYRWWTSGESSRTVHAQREWDRNNGRIVRKLDSRPILLPEGSMARIRAVMTERDEALRALDAERNRPAQVHTVQVERPTPDEAQQSHLAEVLSILESRSWRVSGPMRVPSAILRKDGRIRASRFASMSAGELAHAARALRTSRSWRATAWLRRGVAR